MQEGVPVIPHVEEEVEGKIEYQGVQGNDVDPGSEVTEKQYRNQGAEQELEGPQGVLLGVVHAEHCGDEEGKELGPGEQGAGSRDVSAGT